MHTKLVVLLSVVALAAAKQCVERDSETFYVKQKKKGKKVKTTCKKVPSKKKDRDKFCKKQGKLKAKEAARRRRTRTGIRGTLSRRDERRDL